MNDRLQEVIETSNLEKGKRVQDYRDWVVYEDNLYRLDVTFDEKAALVAISCFSKARLGSCPSIAGVTDGDSEQEVIRKLGAPGTSRIQGVTKRITYPDLGIVIRLEKERVYTLGIKDPRYQPL